MDGDWHEGQRPEARGPVVLRQLRRRWQVAMVMAVVAAAIFEAAKAMEDVCYCTCDLVMIMVMV